MERELTKKFYEILYKCQTWIDDENYILPEFRQKSWSDVFAEKIICGIKEEMVKQKLGFQNGKIYIPSKYLVEINDLDSRQWSGIKREILLQELNKFVGECLRVLSVETFETEFVQIQTAPDIKQPGEIRILHFWDESYSPKIRFNQNPAGTKSDEYEEFSEDTIIAPAFWKNDSEDTENDCETVVRKKSYKFYSLDIWRDGFRRANLPIFQPEITLGRGSPSIRVDVPLEGDLEISRYHASLTYQTNSSFNLSVTGQNPVIIGNKTVFAGQTTTLDWEENFQIGSYVLKMQK